MVPRNSSAAVRSATSENATSSRPECHRILETVRVRSPATSVDFGANRRSGSSVRTSIATSPRMPWARPIRPTTTRMGTPTTGPSDSAAGGTARAVSAWGTVDVHEVDQDALAAGERTRHLADGRGGAPLPPDDLAEIAGIDPD